jgi:hypothetical protein
MVFKLHYGDHHFILVVTTLYNFCRIEKQWNIVNPDGWYQITTHEFIKRGGREHLLHHVNGWRDCPPDFEIHFVDVFA